MASLQARHQGSCKLARPWTTFKAATKDAGCTCQPLYHVVHRHEGALIRDPVGHNRQEASRALAARGGDIARREYQALKDIRFDKWADGWLAGFTGKASTKLVYSHSLDYGKQTFGARNVRDLTASDVRRFLACIEAAHAARQKPLEGEAPRKVAPATLAKHLRQLSACLQAAVDERYATENPVKRLGKSLRPKVAKSQPVYYIDVELARLWTELAERPEMLALCKTAVATGMRFGELAALRWDDIDLLNREIRVSRSFGQLGETTTTKSGQTRTIDLTPPAATMLEEWFKVSPGDGLVFERADRRGEMAEGFVLRRVLYPALERAGVPREGEHGRKRDFHSFRHTFARIALEGGAEITWVSQQLGHSNITLTVNTYGGWTRAAQKSQAERLADAFVL